MSLRSRVYRLLSLQKSSRSFIYGKAEGSDVIAAVFGPGLSFRSYGGQPAAADRLKVPSLCKTCNYGCGLSPVYASATRAMDLLSSSSYRPSKNTDSRTIRQFKRLYSGGPTLLDSGALWMLIGTNVAVSTMWHFLDHGFMQKHFSVSIDSVLRGRVYTILTSAFSQYDPVHLLSNMIGLYFMGYQIARIFGGGYLLTLYLAGAVGGSLGHMFYYGYIYPRLQGIPSRSYDIRFTPAGCKWGSFFSDAPVHLLVPTAPPLVQAVHTHACCFSGSYHYWKGFMVGETR